MEDEYEIFPHKVLQDLKEEVEALKKKLSEPESVAQELMGEMEDLKTTIKELNAVFKEALQDVKEEDSVKLLAALQNKVSAVLTQNETIARGMVAISDKLESFMKQSVGQALPSASAVKPVATAMVSPPLFSNEAGAVPPAFNRFTVRPPSFPAAPNQTGVPSGGNAPPAPPTAKPQRKGIF